MSFTQAEIGFDEFSIETITNTAIETLRTFEPKDRPYYGCFSGGKDSVVIKELARLSGVNVVWHYNVTTIDPPEVVYFIRRFHADVLFHRPEKNFFVKAEKRGFPTRKVRWCCGYYKETKTPVGERMILGVRAEESPARAKRWGVCTAYKGTHEYVISPIIYWRSVDVWNFIRHNKLPYCELYDQGYTRLGCIGCPMSDARERIKGFERYPKFEAKWKRLFQRIWEKRFEIDSSQTKWVRDNFETWEQMYEWWLNDAETPENCQGVGDILS